MLEALRVPAPPSLEVATVFRFVCIIPLHILQLVHSESINSIWWYVFSVLMVLNDMCLFATCFFFKSVSHFEIYIQINWLIVLSLLHFNCWCRIQLYEYTIIYPFPNRWTLKVLLVFDSKNNPAINVFVLVCLCTHLEVCLGNTPSSRAAGQQDMCIFNLTKYHRSSQSGCTDFHSHWY